MLVHQQSEVDRMPQRHSLYAQRGTTPLPLAHALVQFGPPPPSSLLSTTTTSQLFFCSLRMQHVCLDVCMQGRFIRSQRRVVITLSFMWVHKPPPMCHRCVTFWVVSLVVLYPTMSISQLHANLTVQLLRFLERLFILFIFFLILLGYFYLTTLQ